MFVFRRNLLNLLNKILRRLSVKVVRDDYLDMPAMLRRPFLSELEIATVIDIGASNGCWSKLALQAFRNADVLAIEPLVEQQQALLALTKTEPRFQYEPVALGRESGSALLAIPTDGDGSKIVLDVDPQVECRTVAVESLDNLVSKRKLDGPFLLKFDTHGYELPILEGCESTLTKTTAIIMECYNFTISPTCLRMDQMITYLGNYGFRVADICSPSWRKLDGAFWQLDILFLKESHRFFLSNDYE